MSIKAPDLFMIGMILALGVFVAVMVWEGLDYFVGLFGWK